MSSLHFAHCGPVGAHHMALYRGWINGLPEAEIGERYIGESDPRRVRAVVESLRQRFVQAARRANLPRYERLLKSRLRPVQPAQAPAVSVEESAPDLETFREAVDPDGFFDEAELLALYQERFARPTELDEKAQARAQARAKRLERWIEQQQAALFWIEAFLCSKPQPQDDLLAWFEGSACEHLKRHGVATLADLKAFVEQHGKRWHARIEGIGERVADRLVQWLAENAATLGPLSERATLTRLDIARGGLHSAQVAPPQRDDGARGFRAPVTQALPQASGGADLALVEPTPLPSSVARVAQPDLSLCLIRARSDEACVQAWIEAKAGSPHTARAYRREAERFLLFLRDEKAIGLRDVTPEDITDYKQFLALLGRADERSWRWRLPQSHWMAPRNTPRLDPRWRPFEGALSAKSAQQALIILKGLFDFLVQVRYVAANPAAVVSIKVAPTDVRDMPRGLSHAQMSLVWAWLDTLEDSHASARLRFVLRLAYEGALRLSEMVHLCGEDVSLLPREHEPGHYVMLAVRGKGDKIRSVPVGQATLAAWREYAAWRNLPGHLPQMRTMQDAPLIASEEGQMLTESWLYKLIKQAFERAARHAEHRGLWDDGQQLRQCSPHDLRHSRARHLGQSDMPLPLLQRLLGHASIATTGIYTRSGDVDLARAIESLAS